MNTSWVLVGFLSAPQMARIEMHYETEPSGYRAHWTFDEVRVGTLPALAIRGPKEQLQLMELNFQIPEDGIVQFKVAVSEDQEVDGTMTQVPVFTPTMVAQWGQETRIVSNHRERLKWIGRNRWLDVRVELRLTAWPIENTTKPLIEPPDTTAPESTESPNDLLESESLPTDGDRIEE